MFEDVWLSTESKDKTLKRWSTIFLSLIIHVIVIFFVLYGPLISVTDDFPELKVVDVYLAVVPKVPSSMRAARRKTQKKTKLVKKNEIIEKKEDVVYSALIVPIDVPDKIIDEDEEYVASNIAYGTGGGIEGGIEDGEEGGIVGGSNLGEIVEEEIEAVRVKGRELKLIKKIIPSYPPEAIKRRFKGDVIIELTTGPFGNVKKCRIIHGHPLLDASAIAAVKQWVYKPYLVRGKPTPIKTTVLINFTKANY